MAAGFDANSGTFYFEFALYSVGFSTLGLQDLSFISINC